MSKEVGLENETLHKKLKLIKQLLDSESANGTKLGGIKKIVDPIIDKIEKVNLDKALSSSTFSWKEYQQSNKSKFFQNTECEFFPCHPLDETLTLENFNCAFCFCPFYHKICGEAHSYDKDGKRNCKKCTFIHRKENIGLIYRRLGKENVVDV